MKPLPVRVGGWLGHQIEWPGQALYVHMLVIVCWQYFCTVGFVFFFPDCLRLVQDMSCGAGSGGAVGGGGQTHLGAANHTHFGSVLLWK